MKTKANLRYSQCSMPDCKAQGNYSRGLCKKCYSILLREVMKKTFTWTDLEEAKICKPIAHTASDKLAKVLQIIKEKGEKHA